MSESLVTTGIRALLRSRLIAPPGPPALLRVVREIARGGTNLATLLGIAAARWPSRTALIDDEGAVGYRELLCQTESLTNVLRRRGAGSGRAVGILCRNGRGFAKAAFAAAMTGADVVLLNTDFRAEALASAMRSHQIRMLVCDNEFADRAHAAGDDVTVIGPAGVDARDGRPRFPPRDASCY